MSSFRRRSGAAALGFLISAAAPASAAVEMASWLSYQVRHEETLEQYGKNFTSVSVFAYDFTPDDDIRPAQPWVDSTLAALMAARAPGRPVLVSVVNDIETPVLQQRNGDLVLRILSNPFKRARLVAQIAALSARADGVDIDFEFPPPGTRVFMTQFIHELRAVLPQGKLLVVDCQPKTDDGDGGGGQAFDWRAIQADADWVRVMTYASASTPPGPSATLDKVRAVTALAAAEIPRDKLHMVLTQFGWDWPDGRTGRTIAFEEAMALSLARGAAPLRDTASQSLHFDYRDDAGVRHQVWVPDQTTLRAQIDVIQGVGPQKIDVWHLGVGDPAFWVWAAENAVNPNGGGNVPPNPVPAPTALSPSSAQTGGAGFILSVEGAGFMQGSLVRWNGQTLATVFVDPAHLTAAVPAGSAASPGVAEVSVFNPPPGGGLSPSLQFTVSAPPPEISALSPASIPAGSPGFLLTVTGERFGPGAVVRWNGSPRPTVFAPPAQLNAAILDSDVDSPREVSVDVAQDALMSQPVTFTVTEAPPPAVPEGDISQARSFPNPWTADKNAGLPVTFDRLTPESVIRIFTLSARPVRTITAAGDSAAWDLTNDAGDPVVSGYYVYVITDGRGNRTRGKTAVVK